ncbi:MAG: hypothetical protein WC692_05005 [Erythrobacter sp.]|jgi:hypothetical protein
MTCVRFVAVPLALLLAACGGASAPASSEDDRRKARGEVLGGSISDAMIPLDTLESKSPPLRIAPTPAASGEASNDDAAEETEATQPAEASEPAPAEVPAEN